MATPFEELRVLRSAETIADEVWRTVVKWDEFARDVVGKQLTRAIDSIGANVAEAYGRFHYGEKIQFLYYARGSLFETKYWLNRALARELMPPDAVQKVAAQLTDIARQLNVFAGSLKSQRRGGESKTAVMREASAEYIVDISDDTSTALFGDDELTWLEAIPSTTPNL
jgi:four helix bundle protein